MSLVYKLIIRFLKPSAPLIIFGRFLIPQPIKIIPKKLTHGRYPVQKICPPKNGVITKKNI